MSGGRSHLAAWDDCRSGHPMRHSRHIVSARRADSTRLRASDPCAAVEVVAAAGWHCPHGSGAICRCIEKKLGLKLESVKVACASTASSN